MAVVTKKCYYSNTSKIILFEFYSSQKSSGRCWIFAVMNAMRIPFMKKLEIEDFEFSQSYLFFWDKIERSNYYLNTLGTHIH